MDANISRQVWRRLIAGESLQGLGLGSTDGRLDLRGLRAPEAGVVRQYQVPNADVKELSNLTTLRSVEWRGLDLSGAHLESLRFHDCSIDDCSFVGSTCRDWRLWGTTISNTSFRTADLRNSVLGAVDNGRRNSFSRVDFTKTDLRGTVHKSADMVECTFSNANLSKVDFHGTVFVDCTFEGELKDVLFHRQAFRGEAYPPNEMKGVDLRRAKLHYVEFRGLDMATVKWPVDEEHIILDDYANTLERVLAVLDAREDASSRRLAEGFRVRLKWVGRNQRQGVLSKADLIEAGGEGAVGEILRLVRPN